MRILTDGKRFAVVIQDGYLYFDEPRDAILEALSHMPRPDLNELEFAATFALPPRATQFQRKPRSRKAV